MTEQNEYKAKPQPETLIAAMAANDIIIKSEFVPFSQSRNAKEKHKSLNWRVSLCLRSPLDGQDKIILTTDYSAGVAHCPAYKASIKFLGGPNSVDRDEAITWECENGRSAIRIPGFGLNRASRSGKAIEPNPADVMYSLIIDSDALDASSFEDWAGNFGYDADSRNAEKIYRACLKIALKLRNGLGEAKLQALREAAEDC
jgi:hypothetical protein